MRLTNYTKFDSGLIKEIIRFVKPANVTNFDISIKNSEGGWRGRAYPGGCSFHNRSMRGRGLRPSNTLVIIGAPKNTTEKTRYRRPRVTDYGKGYLRSAQFSPVEDMVHLIAHELRHLWQAKVPRGWRVWGARGQYSERDADAYAIRMTRAWRRKSGDFMSPTENLLL